MNKAKQNIMIIRAVEKIEKLQRLGEFVIPYAEGVEDKKISETLLVLFRSLELMKRGLEELKEEKPDIEYVNRLWSIFSKYIEEPMKIKIEDYYKYINNRFFVDIMETSSFALKTKNEIINDID